VAFPAACTNITAGQRFLMIKNSDGVDQTAAPASLIVGIVKLRRQLAE
jgi:hypothetical protein